MARWKRVVSVVGARTIVVGLGALYVVSAVIWGYTRSQGGTPLGNVLVVSALISGFGLLLCYGGYRLPEIDIRPEYRPEIAGWCLVGCGSMFGVLAIYNGQPADSISNPFRALLFLTAFSSNAGFAVGVHDARAKTRAYEVEQRNRELQRMKTQLEDAVTQLEASNERLEQFAYAASHDLQEPLRMVSSYLQLIESRSDDELSTESREFLEFAVDGADRMRTMIESLLEYSRVETQGEPFEPVELDDVLVDVCDDLQVRIENSGAEITTDPLPRVEGDERQLRQVFQNLLSNAIEYSGDGDPRIHVSASRNGTSWTVSVEDEGIGIDPEDQQRIFEVFHRLHGREEHEGTGIGLALCERIVERHDGDIHVDSEPGAGSTFSITLPTVDARAGRSPDA